MNAIKRLYQAPTVTELAAKEMAEAERGLLRAQSAREFADSDVAYHQQRIKRLRAFLKEQGNEA